MKISRPFINQLWKTKSGFLANSIGESRPSDKGGPGHPDPEIRGGGRGTVFKKNSFRAFGPQFGPKMGGGDPPGTVPGTAPGIHYKRVIIFFYFYQVFMYLAKEEDLLKETIFTVSKKKLDSSFIST